MVFEVGSPVQGYYETKISDNLNHGCGCGKKRLTRNRQKKSVRMNSKNLINSDMHGERNGKEIKSHTYSRI